MIVCSCKPVLESIYVYVYVLIFCDSLFIHTIYTEFGLDLGLELRLGLARSNIELHCIFLPAG